MTAQRATIAMPARRPLQPSAPRETKYDLASLAPESADCLIETDTVNIKKAQSRLTSAVASYRKRPGNELHRFAVRTFKDENGQDVVGVWRLADKAPADAAASTGSADASVNTDVASNGDNQG